MQLFSLQDAGGTQAFTGTSLISQASGNEFSVGEHLNDYFFGTIENRSDVDARLIFKLFDAGSPFTQDILARQSIKINGLPIDKIVVLVNGTVTLAMFGSIIRAETSEDITLINSNGSNMTVKSDDKTMTLNFVFDGGGAVIAVSSKFELIVDFDCIVTGWSIVADQSGSCVVDILRSNDVDPPVYSSIAGTEKPTLSSQTYANDRALTSWTTQINAGDIIRANVDSATTVTRVTVGIRVKR